MKAATWVNGKRKITGRWEYFWAADRFVIELDSKDRITGEPRQIEVAGDRPEWGNWRLWPEGER